jgi:lipopolysaccharide/colanic/teichoic acid biosynthesis glycosyltransferase
MRSLRLPASIGDDLRVAGRDFPDVVSISWCNLVKQTAYLRFGKRIFDAVFSFVGIVFLTPLFLLVALAVRATSRGPAFFRQWRTGQFERPFRIWKFRTMIAAPPQAGALLTAAGDPRITPLGKWLRKSKFDELPQLFNVLVGDMSLVGPRPEVPQYTARFSERQKRIFIAKPGITGPSANVYEEQLMASHPDKEQLYLTVIMPAKLEIDLAYCADIRFPEDLRLIFATFITVCASFLEMVHLLRGRTERSLAKPRKTAAPGPTS